MALNHPFYKIQSSMGSLEFANRDLLVIRDQLVSWEQLAALDNPIVRNIEEYHQMIESMRLAALSCHIEILKQAFYEYTEVMKVHLVDEHKRELEYLFQFLNALRNAVSHSTGKLIPKWGFNPKKNLSPEEARIKKEMSKKLLSEGLNVNVPVMRNSGGVALDEKSNVFYQLYFEVKNEQEIPITEDFIHRTRLLSWHILAIVKKRTPATLSRYLEQCKTKEKTGSTKEHSK